MNKKDKLEVLNLIYAIIDYPEPESKELSEFKKHMLEQIDNLTDDIQRGLLDEI